MKKAVVCILLASLLAVLVVSPAIATPPTTITVSWTEDATRYYPDGTYWTDWTGDPNGPMELLVTGKAYHVVDIGEFYNTTLPDVEGSMTISGAGKFSGHATYTSLVSGLPIKEIFNGEITVDGSTLIGSYTQRAYAFGSAEHVLTYYPNSLPEKSDSAGGWWLIGYTEYTAY